MAFLHVDRLGELLEAQPALGLRFASACFAATYALLPFAAMRAYSSGSARVRLGPPVGPVSTQEVLEYG